MKILLWVLAVLLTIVWIGITVVTTDRNDHNTALIISSVFLTTIMIIGDRHLED